jgi:hypothetical protein
VPADSKRELWPKREPSVPFLTSEVIMGVNINSDTFNTYIHTYIYNIKA